MTTTTADAPAAPRARPRARPKGPPEHRCIACRALPERPAGMTAAQYLDAVEAGAEYRPPRPRPTTGGPRSQRCTTHRRAHRNARRLVAATGRRARVYGLDADTQVALAAFQGGCCPCGKSLAKRQTDHDHAAAAEHEHPLDQGCPECVRGFLCWSCNREIVGRFEAFYADEPEPAAAAAAALRRLADYLLDPPLARLRRGEAAPYPTESAS